ncbi:MAG: hypothetical protein K6G76_11330 [Lachnospiraceae bacterium]|nr:hypothetical protein [Lachnospiraceae bacterium]
MYIMERTVTYSQVGSNLTMDMAGVVNFLQDCVLAQSESIGKGVEHVAKHKRAWFLTGWQIELDRYPKYKENITVRTWPHDFKGLYGYRNFDILGEDGRRIVSANSIWVFMDINNMTPTKPTEEDMEGYVLEPALDMDYAARKIKLLPEEDRIIGGSHDIDTPIRVKRSFIDSNQHVNNGRYVLEALDIIDATDIRKLRVDYRKAAIFGDTLHPVCYINDPIRQVSLNDSEGKPYVIVEIS